MQSILQRWIKVIIANLLVIALLGVLLRYKIAFTFPWLVQKNLLHAHSQFAFNGWVSLALMLFIAASIGSLNNKNASAKYKRLLFIQFIAAYGMLFSFIISGYSVISVCFSMMAVTVTLSYAHAIFKDAPSGFASSIWYKTAVSWNVLSTVATAFISYMMLFKYLPQHLYLVTEYFYLHFQYNGWFLFATIGLLIHYLHVQRSETHQKVYLAFTISCIPAYLLSILWLQIPSPLYFLIAIACLFQIYGWVNFILLIQQDKTTFYSKPLIVKRLLLMAAIAFSIKLLLQTFSIIPLLSTLAFGYRSIVIGYLHLILLGVITLLILVFIAHHLEEKQRNHFQKGTYVFLTGIILNELALMTQGTAALAYISIPMINSILFIVACIMLSGILLMIRSLLIKQPKCRPDGA